MKKKHKTMAKFMTAETFATPTGRKAAWRSLMLGDHGFLRKIYDNSHQISAEMWRSYQPSPAQVAAWADRGIKTIINLRGTIHWREGAQPGFYWLEKEACAKHGITLIDFRAFSREAPKREFVLEFDEILSRIEYPVMMHCKSGADRAGIASTLYRFLREGVSLDDALGQLTHQYGHVKSGKTGVLDHFFDTYKEYAVAEGATPSKEHFLDWVKNVYDPQAVNDSFTPGTWGTILTDVILRRE